MSKHSLITPWYSLGRLTRMLRREKIRENIDTCQTTAEARTTDVPYISYIVRSGVWYHIFISLWCTHLKPQASYFGLEHK